MIHWIGRILIKNNIKILSYLHIFMCINAHKYVQIVPIFFHRIKVIGLSKKFFKKPDGNVFCMLFLHRSVTE